MKDKLLAILAIIVFSIALLTPEVLISLNNFLLGKLFFIALLLLFTKYNIVAGCAIAILVIYVNNLTHEGMQTINDQSEIKKIANISKKLNNVVEYDIAGSNAPSTLDKAELSKQLRPIDSKTLPTFTIKDDFDPEPKNPAIENFTVIGQL